MEEKMDGVCLQLEPQLCLVGGDNDLFDAFLVRV